VGQHALRQAGGCKVGIKRQFVDQGLASTRRQVGLENLMLGHASKRHRTTLKVQIVGPTSKSIDDQKKTYAIRQTDNGVYCTSALKEVVTVRIAILAHELNFLCYGTCVATRNVPPSSIGDVRNRALRTPLQCEGRSRQRKGRKRRRARHE
jgi:hypothetical protein